MVNVTKELKQNEQATAPWVVAFGFVIVNCVWGSTYLGIRIAVETIPPFFMAGTRFIVAGCIIVTASRIAGHRLPNNVKEWTTALIMGFLLLAIGNGFVTFAEVSVPSNQAALLISTSALWMAWFGSLGAKGEVLSGRIKFGLAIGFFGTTLMFWPNGQFVVEYVSLQAMVVIAAISWAVGTIYFRNQAKSMNAIMFAGVQMLCGGCLMLIASFILQESGDIRYTPRTAAAWAYLTVFGSCVAFALYVWLIDKIRSSMLAMIAYITPLVATVLGWIVLDEVLAPTQLAGMMVIITSIILVTMPKRRPTTRRFY